MRESLTLIVLLALLTTGLALLTLSSSLRDAEALSGRFATDAEFSGWHWDARLEASPAGSASGAVPAHPLMPPFYKASTSPGCHIKLLTTINVCARGLAGVSSAS
ncbi:hypothetical protein WDV93_11930 [Pantoea ananatis]